MQGAPRSTVPGAPRQASVLEARQGRRGGAQGRGWRQGLGEHVPCEVAGCTRRALGSCSLPAWMTGWRGRPQPGPGLGVAVETAGGGGAGGERRVQPGWVCQPRGQPGRTAWMGVPAWVTVWVTALDTVPGSFTAPGSSAGAAAAGVQAPGRATPGLLRTALQEGRGEQADAGGLEGSAGRARAGKGSRFGTPRGDYRWRLGPARRGRVIKRRAAG